MELNLLNASLDHPQQVKILLVRKSNPFMEGGHGGGQGRNGDFVTGDTYGPQHSGPSVGAGNKRFIDVEGWRILHNDEKTVMLQEM